MRNLHSIHDYVQIAHIVSAEKLRNRTFATTNRSEDTENFVPRNRIGPSHPPFTGILNRTPTFQSPDTIKHAINSKTTFNVKRCCLHPLNLALFTCQFKPPYLHSNSIEIKLSHDCFILTCFI